MQGSHYFQERLVERKEGVGFGTHRGISQYPDIVPLPNDLRRRYLVDIVRFKILGRGSNGPSVRRSGRRRRSDLHWFVVDKGENVLV